MSIEMTATSVMPRAFVVDDDYLIANLFAIALEQVGYTAVKITSGSEAIQRLKKEVPNLIILDIHMPFVSGIDILSVVQIDERLKNVPIVIITADPLAAKRLKGQMEYVFVKPVGFNQLRTLGEDLKARL
jgi:CheY-like chemotaxis protein